MKLPELNYPHINAKVESILKGSKLIFRVMVREFDEDGLKYQAMSLVYTTLLALAPVLAVSFSILKAFGVHNQTQHFLLKLLAPLGDKAAELTNGMISFVENIQVGVLGFVGFLMLFYTSVSLLQQIEECFNHIWRVTKHRSLFRRFSDYLSVILIGPVLLFSAVGISASMANTALVQRLIHLEPLGTGYYLLGLVLPYLLTIAAFAFAYAFIPNTRVSFRAAMAGGIVAGLSWKLSGLLFALFMTNSALYSAIYSGFAVILLSMVWLYISWIILLLGGVVAFHVQYPRYLNYPKRRPRLSIQALEQLGLMLMVLIGRHHIRGEQICTLQSLAAELNLPWEPVDEQLECLTQSGLLVTIDNGSKAYAPARDTDAILLQDILQALRSTGDQPLDMTGTVLGSGMQELLDSLRVCSVNTLQNRSLRDVVKADPSN